MIINRLMMLASAGKASGPSGIGEFFGGGFYAGNIVEGGAEYYIIVAPKALGESTSQQYITGSNVKSPAATETLNNGPAATAAMVATGTHLAAIYCAGLTINGFSDWYLPARDELEIIYRNLKPTSGSNSTASRAKSAITYPEGNDVSGDTVGRNRNSSPLGAAYTSGSPAQTSVSAFASGGAEAFSATNYWCATEFSSTVAWRQNFLDGRQTDFGFKNNSLYVRAIRRVLV